MNLLMDFFQEYLSLQMELVKYALWITGILI